MKACAQYQNDLAAAACSGPLSPNAASHLRDCAACKRALADLQSAATIQSQTAASLPTPTKIPNLHPWLTNKISSKKSSAKESTPHTLPTLHWRPILVTTLALITLLTIVAFLTLPNSPKETTVARTFPPQSSTHEMSLPQPTLISLRHQITNPTDQLLPPRNPAAPLTHYRLIDAHLQLQN